MHDLVLHTLRTAGPMQVEELLADLKHQRWIGEQHDPPIVVEVPLTAAELIMQLHELSRLRLACLGPKGWEPLFSPLLPKRRLQPTLF